MPEVHYQPFDHQSLRIYSTIKYFLAHQIFLCRTVKIFFSPPMDQIFFLARLSEIWTDKSRINSQRTNVSNNGKILWKISFWLFSPDKAESKASEEEVRNFFRLSTTTLQPWTPSSILTRMSLYPPVGVTWRPETLRVIRTVNVRRIWLDFILLTLCNTHYKLDIVFVNCISRILEREHWASRLPRVRSREQLSGCEAHHCPLGPGSRPGTSADGWHRAPPRGPQSPTMSALQT